MSPNEYRVLLLLAFLILIAVVSLMVVSVEHINELRALRKLLKHDLKTHQDWLFHQLYAMAPGKVLKPDELEPEVKPSPAKVYNPNKDPMREFTGKQNDWGY
jgi:hypothetical protein